MVQANNDAWNRENRWEVVTIVPMISALRDTCHQFGWHTNWQRVRPVEVRRRLHAVIQDNPRFFRGIRKMTIKVLCWLSFNRMPTDQDLNVIMRECEHLWERGVIDNEIVQDQGQLVPHAHEIQIMRRLFEMQHREPYERIRRDVSALPQNVQDRRMMVNWWYWCESQWGQRQLPNAALKSCSTCHGEIELWAAMVAHCPGHYFHLECFVRRAHIQPVCPQCLTDIMPLDAAGNHWDPPRRHA